MSEEITIDQVIVRKAGGYNLRTVNWWNEQTASIRHAMIAEGTVQFFAAGTELPTAEAAAILEGASSASAARAPEEVPSSGPIVIPEFADAPASAVYTRRVVEGPRWLVTRTDDDGESELYTVHGYPDASVYDLSTPMGAKLLSNDLLLDALGAPASLAAEHPEAFAHFHETVFDLHLGNRPWEVVASKIRGSLASNPYLRIASSATS